MSFNFDAIWPSMPFLLGGALVTLQYTFASLFFGLILGTVLSLVKISSIRPLGWFAAAYTSLFRGTPLLVQLFIFYFATPQLTGYDITAFQAGLLTLSLNSAAYISEIIRAGIEAVDKGQFEAAISLGVPYRKVMKDIILPQAIKNILPALVNEMVDLIKESSLVSVIGEMDLLRRANLISAEKYIYFEPLLVIAFVYYMLVMIFTKFAKLLEIRMKRSD